MDTLSNSNETLKSPLPLLGYVAAELDTNMEWRRAREWVMRCEGLVV
jgi:hypothetical protein